MDINTQTHLFNIGKHRIFAQSWHKLGGSNACPIILLHDSLGNVALWRDFPKQLAVQTGRQVIAYDRLGFGLSDVSEQNLSNDFVFTEATTTFKALLDYFQFSQFLVLGHSVGGGMAAAIAAQYPKQCVGLITIAAQYEVEELTLSGIRTAKKMFQQAGQLERLEKYHPNKAQWVLDAWTETWLSPTFANWNLSQVLAQVMCPALIIHGELDEYGTTAQAQQLFEGIEANAELHILEGLHHLPHKEQPDLVIALIDEFIQSLP